MKLSLVAILLLLVGSSLSAQQRQIQPTPDRGIPDVAFGMPIPSLHNSPFSAVVSIEFVRQLADGTTITLKGRQSIARDSAGRVFQGQRALVPDDGKHESRLVRMEISDPVVGRSYLCHVDQKICSFRYLSDPHRVEYRASANSSRLVNHEDLGTQTIEGVETKGTRETETIEAGTIGNNNDIHIERERWFSPQLGIDVVRKWQDPRFGIQNFEVSEISIGEPDPKLFQVPADFKVVPPPETTQASGSSAGK
jgi:hypothetical protein